MRIVRVPATVDLFLLPLFLLFLLPQSHAVGPPPTLFETTTISNSASDDTGTAPPTPSTQYHDRFTYDVTRQRADGYTDYAPDEWNQIECDEDSALEACVAYIDTWETGRDWDITQNYCLWCPDTGAAPEEDPDALCNKNRHHQSPINLQRVVGKAVMPITGMNWWEEPDPLINECIDAHWMKYEDASCTLDDLIDTESFTIERHGLRIAQPISTYELGTAADLERRPHHFQNEADLFPTEQDPGVRLACARDRGPEEGLVSRFGRIDFSKGFSHWWYLSHTDVHVPSEHTQDGQRYDAEIQLHHFYSINTTAGETAAVAAAALISPWEVPANVPHNEVATVAVMAQAFDDVAPYPFLDKVICQWRRAEYEVRQACGLDPVVAPNYPGCFPLTTRKHHNRTKKQRQRQRRHLRTTQEQEEQEEDEEEEDMEANQHRSSKTSKRKETTHFLQTVHDVILYNDQHRNHPNHTTVNIRMEESNFEPAEEKNWEAWIVEQSQQMTTDEELYHALRHKYHGGNHTIELHRQYRHLLQGDEVAWFNYWPLVGVKTEYYFRYSGSQTIPPCYGNRRDNSREGTNHWRVMKDPLRIHTRQLHELQRLTAERIAPMDSAINACQPDTAARVTRETEDTTNNATDTDDDGDGDVAGSSSSSSFTARNSEGGSTPGRIVTVNNARPLQAWSKAHFKTFCECKNWESKFPEDRNWCKIQDEQERFYDKPYNFGW